MELKGKRVGILGDSLTGGYGASSDDKKYHQILKARCGIEEILDYGEGGTRIAAPTQIEKDNNRARCFAYRVDEMDETADLAIVFGGTNDYGWEVTPLGTFDDRDVTTFFGALHVMMEKLSRKYIGKQIVIMTPTHRLREIREEEDVRDFRDYVYAMKEVAEFYGIPVLDIYALSGLQPNIPENKAYYFVDGLHPNDAGYAKIADMLEKFLKNL